MKLKLHCLWWFVNVQLAEYNTCEQIHQTPYLLSNNLEEEKNIEILISFSSRKTLG